MASHKPREKLSVSLPQASVQFVEQYRRTHSVASRSEVIDIALKTLRERELERAYAEATREESFFGDLESTNADGLEDDPAW